MLHETTFKKKLPALLAFCALAKLITANPHILSEREWYVRPINLYRRQYGEFHRLIRDLRDSDPERHFKYCRMTVEMFDRLLALVKPKLRHGRNHRFPISDMERLYITLQILANGDSHTNIAIRYRIGISTVSVIFNETVKAIWSALRERYVQEPTEQTWAENARDFERLWQFPNCVGAIDGKHVYCKAPPNSGTQYFNYKKSFSVVLMAIADPHYRFTAIDVGGYGRQSDGGTFSNWELGSAIVDGSLKLPEERFLPGAKNTRTPFVFVADDAFPLCSNVMKPFGGNSISFQQRIFNYRLSRARRIVENAFGILVARWRILRSSMEYGPEAIDHIVLACIALHNFLRTEKMAAAADAEYLPPGFVDYEDTDGTVVLGQWRKEINALGTAKRSTQSVAHRTQVHNIRTNFMDFFNSTVGSELCPWQNRMVE